MPLVRSIFLGACLTHQVGFINLGGSDSPVSPQPSRSLQCAFTTRPSHIPKPSICGIVTVPTSDYSSPMERFVWDRKHPTTYTRMHQIYRFCPNWIGRRNLENTYNKCPGVRGSSRKIETTLDQPRVRVIAESCCDSPLSRYSPRSRDSLETTNSHTTQRSQARPQRSRPMEDSPFVGRRRKNKKPKTRRVGLVGL